MIKPQLNPDPLDALADDFAARCRRGESPSIPQYAAEHPAQADRIRELFPAIAMMERLRSAQAAEQASTACRAEWANVPEVLGDFRILREIGRGGMGIVFEAEQQSLKRRVALKVLPKQSLRSDRDLDRFRREAQIAANLHHTNIVPVFGVGEHEGLHFYVMPLIRGVGLDQVIRQWQEDGQIDAQRWKLVCDVGIQAAEALGFAHQHGTLHRDVKPGNLLLEDDGTICVADFGLARAMEPSDGTPSGDCLGTLRYMAPEQFDDQADQRSDIYSLGLTLYELATLRAAFQDSRRRSEARGGAVASPPVRPAKLAPGMPRDLETIILKCMAELPQHRYQTAGELAADLRRFAADRPIRARRVSVAERAYRWSRRNPALAAVSTLAALSVVAVAITLSISYVKARSAHVETVSALAQAESNSELALDVLEHIYQQLSSDRIGICSESDPDGAACACTELGPHTEPSTSSNRAVVHVHTSQQTVVILEKLLTFYDRLADQVGRDTQVVFESAVACRRVGDIHQRLGQMELAEADYRRALGKLDSIRRERPLQVALDLARNHNEIGNVRFARQQMEAACQSHQQALAALVPRPLADLPETHRYELARTYYYLANRVPGVSARSRGRDSRAGRADSMLLTYRRSDYRQQAADLLERLIQQQPNNPDYRFLLAICRRPLRPVTENSRDAVARKQSIAILQELVAQHSQVPGYRYELAVTFAWVHVGLYPWQANSAAATEIQPDLRRAVEELQWLVDHSPAMPHYAESLALALAKLATVCRTQGELAESRDRFRQAFETQDTTVAYFPDLPAHHRVLVEFYRLRGLQVHWQMIRDRPETVEVQELGNQLAQCVDNLTSLLSDPDLAQDRLAQVTIREACSTLAAVQANR